MKIANLCVSHKFSDILSDEHFFHIQVGAQNSIVDLGVYKDNDGSNISCKNPNYCELTALYWFWKNQLADYDFVILNHYRRLFLDDDKKLLSKEEVERLAEEYDVLVPYPKHYPVSIRQQYEIMHFPEDFAILEEVVRKNYPDYNVEKIWDKSNTGFLYNMFGMSKDWFDKAMTFVFTVLDEVESRIDISQYDRQQARVFGFMSERLLSLFIQENFSKIKYLPIRFVDAQDAVHVIKEKNRINDILFTVQRPFQKASTAILRHYLVSKSK